MFSLGSVITVVGLVDELGVMIATMVIAVLLMMISGEEIMLALSFLLLVGFVLVAEGEGFDQHIPKGFNYSPWSSRCSWSS